jgi:chemotaxis protein MotB
VAKIRIKKRYVDVAVIDLITVLFASLNTLLLAFFIALNAQAVPDAERQRIAIGSLRGTFGSMPGGNVSSAHPGMLSNPEIEVTHEQLDVLTATLSRLFGNRDLEGDIDVFLRGDDVVIQIANRLLFAEGTDALLPSAVDALRELIANLMRSPCAFSIEGHSDSESPFPPEFGSRWMFAAAQAARIYDLFLSEGLPPERISVASHGDTQPRMPEETDRQREMNRRTEIVVVDGAHDATFRPRTRTVNIGGIEVEVENTPPSVTAGPASAASSERGG